MQLTYVDSTLSLTMRLEIGKSVIVFVASLDKQLVNGMQLLTCFLHFHWVEYLQNSIPIGYTILVILYLYVIP